MSALLCPKCSSQLPAAAKVDIVIGPEAGVVYYHGKALALGNAQFLVLKVLCDAKGQFVPTRRLTEFFEEEGNVRVAVNRLRDVLGKSAIENTPGLGYRLMRSFAKGAAA